jgi:hypothetical protein
MSTAFDRYRAQLRCESFLSCTTLEEWAKADFKNFQLNSAQATLLNDDLREDSKDLYYKGLLSLLEGLKSIESKLFSWATVKLYYSIYYFLRATLAVNGIALIRNKSLFYLRALTDEKPVKKDGKNYSSDHSGTIRYFSELYSSDILLSQTIEGTNTYEWVMHKREQVNYRERRFNEPLHSDFWEYIAEQSIAGNFKVILEQYVKDQFLLCFQREHSILAIPIKRSLLTKERFDQEGIDIGLTLEQREVLQRVFPLIVDLQSLCLSPI